MTNPPLILVVDDSPIQRKIYSGMLKANGYNVLVGENGRQAVTLALQHSPDLILMDISMPEMDGLSAVRELRTHPEVARVPILALTAAIDLDELEKARQAGYTDSVDKSGDRNAFLDKVRQCLSS
jgi:CheY-like chemotaxis protein